MIKETIFLKLGGSLITDKDKPYTPRLDKLKDLALEIKTVLDSNPELILILGHGSGSFGHTAAKKYGTREGILDPKGLLRPLGSVEEYWKGFAEVRFQAAELTRYVMQTLLEAGVPSIPFSPSASMVSFNRKVTSHNILAIRKSLAAHLLPVVHGDVAFDEALGGTILSTEDVFAFLAEHLPPTRILLAGIEAGVWEDFPARTRLVKQIRLSGNRRGWVANVGQDGSLSHGDHQIWGCTTPIPNEPQIQLSDYEKMKAGIGGSASTDVTGGMKAKVEEMFGLIQKNKGLTTQIFSAEENGLLFRALNGENVGTLLSE